MTSPRVIPFPMGISDHDPVCYDSQGKAYEATKGPGMWRHNDTHCLDANFREQLEDQIAKVKTSKEYKELEDARSR